MSRIEKCTEKINRSFEEIDRMISSELDINSLKNRNLINFDFTRLSFYLNHLWLVKIFRTLRLTYLLRLEVSTINNKLKSRLAEVIAIIVVVDDSYKDETNSSNTSELIKIFEKEVDRYSYLHNEVQKMFQYKFYENLGDWDTTNLLLTHLIEANYKLIRVFKKLNKRTSILTTQLAKDTVSHSRSTLRRITDGH